MMLRDKGKHSRGGLLVLDVLGIGSYFFYSGTKQIRDVHRD